MIGAVFPWTERIFRLQLQFFSPGYVGINYCNVTPFLYSILSFQKIKGNNFVPNCMGGFLASDQASVEADFMRG